jgi:hypothetical protein
MQVKTVVCPQLDYFARTHRDPALRAGVAVPSSSRPWILRSSAWDDTAQRAE